MTARNPLYHDSGNLIEMSSAQLLEWQRAAIQQYAANPSVVITVGSGNIGTTMSDTRFRSSTATQQASSFATAGSLGTVTTTFNKIVQTITNPSVLSDTGKSFPVYYDSSTGSVQAMSLADFLDTFIKPAIVLMTASSEANAGDFGGTYAISTSSSAASGFTNVSSTAVFIDTRANTGSFTSGQIGGSGSTQDHSSTVNSFFMNKDNGDAITPSQNLLYIDGDNNLKEYATSGDDAADILDVLEQFIRDLAASDDSASDHNIRYNINGSGQTRGTAMTDTKLNGSGSQTNRFVGGNDYRSQRFPNGSATTINTYNFKINRE
tara:strand:- start:218 stop:1180 length:963 start_codon:yes stop_codon:yes gene_type:complete